MPASVFFQHTSKFFAPDSDCTANLLAQIANLQDAQHEWSLLSKCINDRHTHRFRLTPPSSTIKLATEHDALVWKAMCHICPPLSAHDDIPSHHSTAPQVCADPTSLQVRSPHADGGLGLIDARTTHHLAYIASVRDALPQIISRLSAQGLEEWAAQLPACIPGLSADWACAIDTLVAANAPVSRELLREAQDHSSPHQGTHS